MTDGRVVTDRSGHTWWYCPNCRQKLGEIVGERVVIRIGSVTLRLSLRGEPDQTCPRCGQVSVLHGEMAA